MVSHSVPNPDFSFINLTDTTNGKGTVTIYLNRLTLFSIKCRNLQRTAGNGHDTRPNNIDLDVS